MNCMAELQDIVAKLPDPILQLIRLGGVEGKDFFVERGFIAQIPGEQYFIHTRAMLPLKDLKNGVGFGLWVSVTKSDFELYRRAVNNDSLYRRFSVVGSLANDWPGFPDTHGDRVRVRTVHLEEKVYITEYLSEPDDVLMRVALLAQPDDFETKEKIRELAMGYLIDLNQFVNSSHSENTASPNCN